MTMLDLMRRQSYLIYLIFGGIIFIFAINFGPGQSGCAGLSGGNQKWVVRVEGEPVRPQEFAMLYHRQLAYLKRLAQRSGRDFDAAMADRMGLRSQVMDTLIERKLLAQEGRNRGLYVSDDELLQYLREQYGVKDVAFQTYQDWVTRTFDTTVARFESDTRGDITARHMVHLVTEVVDVGEAELQEEFRRAHDRAKISFVRFDIDPEAVPVPTASEVEAALKNEAAAVEGFYNRDLVNYRTPLEVHVRQIVRHVDPDASDSDIAEARKLLAEVQQKVQQGADFAALAKQYSQDKETAEKGGDMGFVTRGTLARPLELAIFGLQQGQMTDAPVRSPSGLHVLQVLERKEPQRKEFATVREDVARSMLKDRIAARTAETGADRLFTAVKAGGVWDKLTEAEDEAFTRGKRKTALPTRRDSSWILRTQEAIPRIGSDRELHEQIFTLADKAPLASKVFRVNQSFYVVRLLDREVPDMAKFDAEKAELREEALETKRNRVLRDWLAYLRNQAKIQMNPAMQGLTSAGV